MYCPNPSPNTHDRQLPWCCLLRLRKPCWLRLQFHKSFFRSHFGTIVRRCCSRSCPPQTHLMSKIVRSHPRLAGPDLMQPAIRLQESDFPKQAHPYPPLCKFLPPLTWVLVASLYTKLSNCEITCLLLLFPLGSGLIRAFIYCERSWFRSQVFRRAQRAV
jgi:hypothetical protein